MKIFRNGIVAVAVILFFAACRSTPNHLSEPVNSTESGSGVDLGDGLTTDTISPVQPNGIDTSGEQTGRMTNTTANQGLPKPGTGVQTDSIK